jgi:hypothetical protein
VNIWVETIDGSTAEDNRYVMFIPENQDITEEAMYASPDADGNFSVTLIKGETYHVLIQYKQSPSVEGVIKFNESLYNQVIVPADAPNNFNLGILHATGCTPYGFGGSNVYVAENPLPWLTDVIDISNNTNPEILILDSKVTLMNDPETLFGYQRNTYTVTATDDDGDHLNYCWFLSTPDKSASVDFDDIYIRTVGEEARIFLNSAESHGTLTLLVIDAKGGSTKRELSF